MRANTVRYGEQVAVVVVKGLLVHTILGQVLSTGNGEEDNRHTTRIFGDKIFPDVLEEEKVMHLSDPHLLTLEEARELRDPSTAREWFSFYGPAICDIISERLEMLSLDSQPDIAAAAS